MKGRNQMSTEQNKAIANRIPAEFSKGNIDILNQVVDPKAVDHAVPPGTPATVESTKQFMTMLTTAFPDLRYQLEDVIAEGDLVVQRVTASGTMKGALMGMPATGKKAAWSEIHIVRMANGKVVEHWANVDQMSMLQQLGLMPAPGQGK
jgi:predicted ester cyclase